MLLIFILTLLGTAFVTAGSAEAPQSKIPDGLLTEQRMRRLMAQQPSESYNDELEQCDMNCKFYESVARFLIDWVAENGHCSASGQVCSLALGSASTAACLAVGFGPLNPLTWACTYAVGSIWSTACNQICAVVTPDSAREAAKESELAALAHRLAMQMAPMCLSEEEKKNDFIKPILNPLPDQSRCGLCIKEKDRWLIESCHKCLNPSTIWKSHGGVRACGQPKQLKRGDKCNVLDTCLNCEEVGAGQKQYSYWWDAKTYACGVEAKKWKDGTTCFLGTSCRACINEATWWVGKFLVKCGKEPCWGGGTKCYGTACRQCCSGSHQKWYWFGYGYCK